MRERTAARQLNAGSVACGRCGRTAPAGGLRPHTYDRTVVVCAHAFSCSNIAEGRHPTPSPTIYELADFHPDTGHLHACTTPDRCDCAAWLYCVAQDAGPPKAASEGLVQTLAPSVAPPAVTATLGSRSYRGLPACTHCRAPIRETNYSIGPSLEHYDPDASFRDSVWWHCRLTVATAEQT